MPEKSRFQINDWVKPNSFHYLEAWTGGRKWPRQITRIDVNLYDRFLYYYYFDDGSGPWIDYGLELDDSKENQGYRIIHLG